MNLSPCPSADFHYEGGFRLKYKPIVIKNILSGSIASEAQIEIQDKILSINNEKILDIFDYKFQISNTELLIQLEKSDGEIWEIEIEKDEYEDLGVEFENTILDNSKKCKNKCIFCFIDQLPKGMRKTLYFKDDDFRLSFLMGNYVTLTNVSDKDLDRIIKYKMSPINVSVHTTDPDLRVKMLRNNTAHDVLSKIKKLISCGIKVNCQIVLLRDINDNDALNKTIEDLLVFYPQLNSISVVPVGLTKYRNNLPDLKAFDKESSLEVIDQIEKWQNEFLESHGSRVVYIADEFYTLAEKDIPLAPVYEDFPQIENGVGLISMFRQEFVDYLEKIDYDFNVNRNISIATGVSSFKYINELVELFQSKFENIKVNVYKIKNEFFGENITVTGLITGRDLIEQLKGKELGTELLICKCMLKFEERLFLDNYTVSKVEDELDVMICTVDNDGRKFVKDLLGMIDLNWRDKIGKTSSSDSRKA